MHMYMYVYVCISNIYIYIYIYMRGGLAHVADVPGESLVKATCLTQVFFKSCE